MILKVCMNDQVLHTDVIEMAKVDIFSHKCQQPGRMKKKPMGEGGDKY